MAARLHFLMPTKRWRIAGGSHRFVAIKKFENGVSRGVAYASGPHGSSRLNGRIAAGRLNGRIAAGSMPVC